MPGRVVDVVCSIRGSPSGSAVHVETEGEPPGEERLRLLPRSGWIAGALHVAEEALEAEAR